MYAPLLASPSTYFGDVDDRDEIRDGVLRFADARSGPRLLYNKLLDLVGPVRFPALARKLYAERVPLRRAATDVFGADLGWFWKQWLDWLPAVNYHLDGVRVAAGGGRVSIDVRREGASIREPVEVKVVDRVGGEQTLVWDDARRRTRSTSSSRRAWRRSRSIRATAWSRPRRDRCPGSTIRAWTTGSRRAGASFTKARARCSTSRRRH